MAKLIWTEESLRWLRDIGDYLAERSPKAAVSVTEGIFQKAQVLIDHPKLGYRFQEIEDREVRELIYGHYRIVYELKDSNAVYVLAVFHAAMDIERLQF